jgi:rhodanese-related sulfurtransferase
MKRRILALLLICLFIGSMACADEMTLGDVNAWLNGSAKLGEGSKGNQIAVIPFSHIDGPREEDQFYAFVPFKYVSRSYIKYQVDFLSCTCRPADMNMWTTAYVELTLPDSGKIDDAEVRTLSFDLDSTGKLTAGHWGDSNPAPNGNAYEKFVGDWVPFYTGKTYGQIKAYSTIADIAQEDFQAGEGRGDLTIDAWTGATVSPNNVLRMLIALFRYHATDAFFDGDEAAVALREAFAASVDVTAKAAATVAVGEEEALPAPQDTTKTYLANADDKEETPCEEGNFGPTCSAITSDNLRQYLFRSDVIYIDLRDYEDYAKKHLKGFEVIPYNALIFNADAINDPALPQLYGGETSDPQPVYKESDEILAALFPKNKILFVMCQGGGRASNMMNILKARGWDVQGLQHRRHGSLHRRRVQGSGDGHPRNPHPDHL